jgi:hypothetical protein
MRLEFFTWKDKFTEHIRECFKQSSMNAPFESILAPTLLTKLQILPTESLRSEPAQKLHSQCNEANRGILVHWQDHDPVPSKKLLTK